MRQFYTTLGKFLKPSATAIFPADQLERLAMAPLDEFRLPKRVNIVEVGPRDGLQSSKYILSVDERANLIQRLDRAGLRDIEVGALVSEKAVPKMAQSDELFKMLLESGVKTRMHMLVPNERYMHDAVKLGVKTASVFVSAAEDFSRKNTKRSVDEGFDEAAKVCRVASENNIRVRGYLSCVFHSTDPNEIIYPVAVRDMALRLLDMGCYEVSLGDTLGTNTPLLTFDLISNFSKQQKRKLALHFHDTNGRAPESFIAALQLGLRTFDSSIAGLGGCPFAPGAAGNVDTLKLYYLSDLLGIKTGIDGSKLMDADRCIRQLLASKEHGMEI